MSDLQSVLFFVATVIAISSLMVIILHNSALSKTTKKEAKEKNKIISNKMQKEGLDLIKQELMYRELSRHKNAYGSNAVQPFVVYDTETGESYNYYKKKR